MSASSYPRCLCGAKSALYTRAEHHRSQLQLIPALLWGHCGSKSGHKEARGSPSTVSYTHLSISHTLWASRPQLHQHRGCTEQPAPGHGAPWARRARPPPTIAQQRAVSGTALTSPACCTPGSPEWRRCGSPRRRGPAATSARSSAWPGRGARGPAAAPRSNICLRAHGVNARPGARRGRAGRFNCYRIAGSAARTRRGRGGPGARCRAAGAPGSAARRARGSRGRRGPIRAEGCGRTVSGAGGAGGTAPSRSAQNGTYRNGWSRSSARPATQQLQAAAHSASTAGSARHLRWAEGSGAERGPAVRPPPPGPAPPLPSRHPAAAPGHVMERMSPGHVRKLRSRDAWPSPHRRGAALRCSGRAVMAVPERRPVRPSPCPDHCRCGRARPRGAGWSRSCPGAAFEWGRGDRGGAEGSVPGNHRAGTALQGWRKPSGGAVPAGTALR